MSSTSVNPSCSANFKRIDKDMDVVREDIKEIGQKLAAVDSRITGQDGDLSQSKIDHDDIVLVKYDAKELKEKSESLDKKVEKISNEQMKLQGSIDNFASDITSNMSNLAAYQNSTIDKLTFLVKREPYSDIKSKIVSGLMIGFLVAIITSVVMFILSHAMNNMKIELIRNIEIERIKQVEEINKFNRRMDKNGEYEKSIPRGYYR